LSTINKYIDYLKSLVDVLPDSPGVYQFFNEDAKIIYVGKARNLKRRVSSYFTKNHDNRKTAILVRNIADIKHIVVETEEDALLLENNLIKKYQPRYNVLLKDDKTYPWICVKNESFPRVFLTRNIVKDGSLYFGPYTSAGMVRTLLDLFRQLYPIRTCSLNLSSENIQKKKFKVCLGYHLGNCLGPCEDLQTEEDYNSSIHEIIKILKGNINAVMRELKEKMRLLAAELKFEEAARLKQKLDALEKFRIKATVVSSSINNVDVFSFDEDEKSAYVNFLKVVNGAVIQAHTVELKKRLEESREELFALAISDIRQKIFSTANEILVPFDPDIELSGVKFVIPQRGDKKKLLELSQRNVKYYRLEKQKQESRRSPEKRVERVMETMKKDLRLREWPGHIECFDNSNLQGTHPVSSCVVFHHGKPARREYRHFNVKTVEGPNDFASMEEVIFRRYKRLLEEEKGLPQLIVIDGGKGQLGAALNALEKLSLRGKIAVIGIAKRLEEIFFPGDSIPLYLDKNSETLKIIQRLRDEAHRFGISFHRNKRSKGFIHSELEQIEGIGPKSIEKLLKEFKSVKKIRELSLDELTASIGAAKGKVVFEYFHELP